MQARAMAMARWLLPVPVPPISTALRCSAMNLPLARSRTSASLIGVPVKSNSSMSLASGSLGMARHDIGHEGGGMNAAGKACAASRFHRDEPVGQHRGENLDHLAVAVV